MRINAKHPLYRYTRCWADDVEVTNICVEADDLEGWCRVITKDQSGQLIVHKNEFVYETFTGVDVRFVFEGVPRKLRKLLP